MDPPEGFVEEYWSMRERMDWAESALGRGQDLAQAKTVLEDFHNFYDRWRQFITDAEVCEGLDRAREHMEKTLGRKLDCIFLAHLEEVIEARKDWCVSELLFEATLNFIGLMKHVPPRMRSELEKIHRESMQCDFDAETDYREAEADAAESETLFRQALAGLEVDWPERMDAAMRARLEKLDVAGANDWQAEIAAQFGELERKDAA